MGEGINEFLLAPEGDTSQLEKNAKKIHKKYGNSDYVLSKKKKSKTQSQDEFLAKEVTSPGHKKQVDSINSSISKGFKLAIQKNDKSNLSKNSFSTDKGSIFNAMKSMRASSSAAGGLFKLNTTTESEKETKQYVKDNMKQLPQEEQQKIPPEVIKLRAFKIKEHENKERMRKE